MTHICIVTDAWFPQVNGVVRTLDTVRGELEKMGHQVSMITPEGFKTFPCPTYPEIRLSRGARNGVRAKLEEVKPEAIHIATEGPLGMAARKYCLKEEKPFSTSFHTRFPEYIEKRTKIPASWIYAWLRRFHAASSGMLVPTQSMTDELVHLGFEQAKVWTRGVDLERYQPADDKSKLDEYPRPIWLNVGRVAVEKNLEAFLSLELEGTKLIVGDGPDKEKLQKKYPDAVFLGKKEGQELADIYAASDVFVFPSKSDTFGIVLLEAMASGLPVAAYPVTGPVDVVTSRRAGVLDDVLAVACKKALSCKPEHARAHAETFSWTKCAELFYANLAIMKH